MNHRRFPESTVLGCVYAFDVAECVTPEVAGASLLAPDVRRRVRELRSALTIAPETSVLGLR